MLKEKRTSVRIIKSLVAWSLFALLFNTIYGLYSHGVSSNYMSMIWIGLLGFGILPQVVVLRLPAYVEKEKAYTRFNRYYYSGLAILAVGSLLKGIVEIAGADSGYLVYYLVFGGLMTLMGLSQFLTLCLKFKGKFFTHHNAHSTGHH